MNYMPKEEMMKSIESVLNSTNHQTDQKQTILTAQLISVLIDIRDVLNKQKQEKPIHIDSYDVQPGTGKLP